MKELEKRYQRLFQRKDFKHLNPTSKQKYQIKRILKHFRDYGERDFRKQNTFKYLPYVIEAGVDNAFLERHRRLAKMKNRVTKKRMVIRYGKEQGLIKWNEYCKRQSITNTFEFKKAHYGWDEKDFIEYNQKRAVTKENLIHRHGEQEGLRKWKEYCKKQSYSGCQLEYFQEKYGIKEGRKYYEELNKKKAHTLENYITRYGDVKIAKNKLSEFFNNKNTPAFVSKISQDFCWDLYFLLPEKVQENCYFHEINKEFLEFDPILGKCFLYDFVITGDYNICIEFNGDYFHANPKIYKPGTVINIRGEKMYVEDVWRRDQYKEDILRNKGFDVIIVWEDDYRNRPMQTLQEVYHYIFKNE